MAIYNIKHEDGSQEFLGEPLHDCTKEDFDLFYELDDKGKTEEKSWNSRLNT